MIETRGYQERTVTRVLQLWANGCRSVLVVAPPGSGKTEIAQLVVQGKRVLWIVHTRELANQALERLRARFGQDAVTAIMGGHLMNENASVYVATVQSLLLRMKVPTVDVVVLDEAHHYVAPEWSLVLHMAKGKPLLLGLTATPERQDGTPLGDIFEELVVAATYSELRAGGYIVPARVIAPVRDLGSHYAQNPIDAYAQWSEGSQTFAFFPLIRTADMYAKEWIMRAVDARTLHSGIPRSECAKAFDEFECGECNVLSTVAAIIEGVNVPNARVAILGRSFDFVGGYLQATGRALRSHPGKEDAIIIDLTGATLRHGAPDDDRKYSLEGRAISHGTGSGGAGGGSGPMEPEVMSIQMRITQRGALGEMAEPKRIELPARDVQRYEQKRLSELRARAIRTKHGSDVAKAAQEYFESLGR